MKIQLSGCMQMEPGIYSWISIVLSELGQMHIWKYFLTCFFINQGQLIAAPKMLFTTRKQCLERTYCPAILTNKEPPYCESSLKGILVLPQYLGWLAHCYIHHLIGRRCHWGLHPWLDKKCHQNEGPSTHSPSHCRYWILEALSPCQGKVLW